MVRLNLGRAIGCSDGPFGELADVVIDPVKRTVTHLVVKPHHHPGLARLIPVDLVDTDAGDEQITLRCTGEEAAACTTVGESGTLSMDGLSRSDPDWDIGIQDVLAVPSYSPSELGAAPMGFDAPIEVMYDRVPKGEVEIRRDSPVVSADDHHLGDVEAFLTDGGAITHIVLRHGHLFGRREVTIPMSAVAKVETDAVTLNLSKGEVGSLPSVHVRRGD
jgi:sporulation protein YlmC with PRC-barrel domain